MTTQTAESPVGQWNHLPDIKDTGVLSSPDRACLDAIRDVLAKHGCLDRFGVNLLHKHFDMAPDEILVEQADEQGRKLVTKPIKVALVAGALATAYETQWHWRRGEDGAVTQICIARCFPGSPESPGHAVKHVGW